MILKFYFKPVLFLIFFISINNLVYSEKIIGLSSIVNICNLPSSNTHFTGRKETLEQIHNGFEKGDYIIALVGFLGTGKTQIARRFAELSKSEYDIVWFIDAKASIVDQFRGLAAFLNRSSNVTKAKKININAQPSNLLEQIHVFLKLTPKKWLLVLDNVQERGAILDFLPPKTDTSQGKILVTTRSEIGWENPIKIGNFSHQESMSLLKDIIQTDNEDYLDKLAALLFNHPLSLTQAGCYLRKYSNTSVKNYISLFTNRRKDLWDNEETMIKEDEDIKDFHDNYHMTGSTALRLSLEELKNRSPLALKLLYHTAFLHNSEIPADILAALSKNLGYEPIFECNDAIHQLTKLSLFEKNKIASARAHDNSFFNMHDLTQVVLLDAQSLEEKKQAISIDLAVFTEVLSGGWDKITKELAHRPYLLAHIESLCAHAKTLKLCNGSLVELMTYLLEYHMYHTRDQETYKNLAAQIDDMLKTAKDVSPLVIARFSSDKVYARALFKKSQTEKNFEESIQIFREHPKEIAELFRAHINFAQFFLFQGNYEKALAQLHQAETFIHSIKSERYKNLFYFVKSWILCRYGKFEESQETINLAINNLEKEENEALRIYIQNMKAWVDLKNGDYERAYQWAERTQKMALEFFDKKNNDSIAWTTLVRGVYNEKKGNFKAAEEAMKESLERLERHYGGPMVTEDQAFAHRTLGNIYMTTKRLEEAKQQYQISEKIYSILYTKKEGDGLSELYTKFAILGAKLKDDFLAKHYFDLHSKYFKENYKQNKEIVDAFHAENLELLL
ncbi:MAG: hypothetical protein H0X26_08835 [Alphaproteobacteria bacterium]|nr:hypothetical protein [Alphaproteobacteria bacterium]